MNTPIDTEAVRKILTELHQGACSIAQAQEALSHTYRHACPHIEASKPTLSGAAQVDLDRKARLGVAEVIFGEGKRWQDIAEITEVLLGNGQAVLCTRISQDTAEHLKEHFIAPLMAPRFGQLAPRYHPIARCWQVHPGNKPPTPIAPNHTMAVVSAGTCDQPVAQEAIVTAQFLGVQVEIFTDVGIAGLHRLLRVLPNIQKSAVVLAVAGMEGALASVLAGLLPAPVIGVPTAVGYGVGEGGHAALHAMLTSCASGMSVVNIGNGFGAAMAGVRILQGMK